MKFILAVLVFMFAFSYNAQESSVDSKKTEKKQKKKKDVIVFKTYIIERNDIPYGSDETFSFEFKNNGKTPIIISNVGTSCGCTTASKPEKPINPKEKSVISVKYDTKRVGPFTKTINVTNNITAEPIVLTIKGTVKAEEVKN